MTDRNRTAVIAAFVLMATSVHAPAQIPLGSEFRVDTRGSAESGPRSVNVAVPPDGDFVVAWQVGSPVDIEVVARRFGASDAVGPEFLVPTYTTNSQFQSAVDIDDAGNFNVVWLDPYRGIFGQRFAASGTRRGGEFEVAAAIAFVTQDKPDIALAPGGGFVVVWSRQSQTSHGIVGRRYDSSGVPSGTEFQVNSTTTNPFYQQQYPSVAADRDGNFVVVWVRSNLGTSWVLGRRFTADGTPQGADFAVSSGVFMYGIHLHPRVARTPEGSFVVVWSYTDSQEWGDVLARRFTANATPVGSDFRVNEYTTSVLSAQHTPDVDVDADGDFVITWTSQTGQDGDREGVFGRRFDSSGVPGSEFRLSTYTTGTQWNTSVSSDSAGNFVVAWVSNDQNGVDGVFAQRYAGGLSAAALTVDGAAGPTSDGNGVFEAGETVTVAPAWLNANFGTQTFAGTVSSFTGPGTPGDPTYAIADGSASYGTVASGATATCAESADCFALGTSVPSTRPGTHWDATFREEIAPANLGAAKNWSLHVGDSFTDVPRASGFYRFVETVLHRGITAGCGATQFCPAGSTTRDQMAVFVLAAKDGGLNTPPACTTPVFNDVPASSPFCPWIEELARRGVVAGCGGGNYCPSAAVSREQMAVFTLLTKEPGVTPPACGTPMFSDVPASSPFCRWIEELARRNVVTGCGGGNYCPAAAVTREQMAVFISATFGLTLYGP